LLVPAEGPIVDPLLSAISKAFVRNVFERINHMKSIMQIPPVLRLHPLISLIIVLLSPVLTLGTSQPVYHPNLKISKAIGSIEIDSRLDDAGWNSAARIDNFIERNPGDNTPPEVPTEVYATYDDSKFYIAFVCHDDPKTIRATMSQRDQWSGDDAVYVLLDTYGNAAWAYEFIVNPYGIQKDRLWSSISGEEDAGHDLIWESSAQITDSGYQVEIAIPFASMRFPNRDIQTWRIDFWRGRPRENYKQYSWAAYDRNEQCWPCQWGTAEGIHNVHPGKGIEILPSYVANKSGELNGLPGKDVHFENHDAKGEMSLGGKYSISSDVTMEAAYNPDYSQIEADAAQIDVNSTIALMYPERRPYFQEGSDIFRTMFNSFYTRMINDPQYTAKLTGRMGKNTLGYLFARDANTPYLIPLNQSSIPPFNAGKSTVNILRAGRSFGQSSRIGLMLNDRRFEDNGANSVLSLDGLLRLSKSYSFDFQFIGTYTKEQNDTALTSGFGDITFDHGRHTLGFDGESYYGSAFVTRFYRSSRNLNFTIDYNQLDRTYRTETGYDPVINHRTLNPHASYTFYFDKGILQRLTPQLLKFNRWDFDGNVENDGLNMGLGGVLNVAQASFYMGYNRATRAYNLEKFTGLWDAAVNINASISGNSSVDFEYGWGRDIYYGGSQKGDYSSLDISLYLKPIDRITIEPDFNYYRMSDIITSAKFFSGYISRTRLQYQATTGLSFRLVVQYDDFNRAWGIDPLMTYRLNSFSVFYVGSTYDYTDITAYQINEPDQIIKSNWRMTSRQFFIKLQYLFQT
jgi:hypothetical protein